MSVSDNQRKKELRSRVKLERLERSKMQQDELAGSLTKNLRQLVTDLNVRALTCYIPVAGEPDTRHFIAWALKNGIQVFLPRSRRDGSLAWVESNDRELSPGLFGIPEPVGEAAEQETLNKTELMLIPAAAADLKGNRLGWGRGYFDRFLETLQVRPPVYAIVYDSELLIEIPTENHDVPVSGIVTPARVINF